jgi:hypothetical protein
MELLRYPLLGERMEAKEQNKKNIYKVFNQFFIEYNESCNIIDIIDSTPLPRRPRLNNNSKAIFAFIVGCHTNNGNYEPIRINNAMIQKGTNCSCSNRTIYNHIKLLVDAGILYKSELTKEFFMLSVSLKLQNTQILYRSKEQKDESHAKLLTRYKSDFAKYRGRKNFLTSNISERYINIKRGVEKIEANQPIEKIQSVSASIVSTKKNYLKDTEKNAKFVPEKNIKPLNYPDSSVNTGGRDFSFINQFFLMLVPLLYKDLKDYQRALIIKVILNFNTPKLQENAIRTITKVHLYCKKHPDYRLPNPETFFDQKNSLGFFKALNWPDFEAINKRRNIEMKYVKDEVVYAKKLYYEHGLNVAKVIEQGKKLVDKYSNEPIKQKYVRKSLIPFINQKNNLFSHPKPK